LIFGGILQTHLDGGYVYANFLVNFFNIPKYVFKVGGAYAPESRIEFR
jgi:hypothetical protein